MSVFFDICLFVSIVVFSRLSPFRHLTTSMLNTELNINSLLRSSFFQLQSRVRVTSSIMCILSNFSEMIFSKSSPSDPFCWLLTDQLNSAGSSLVSFNAKTNTRIEKQRALGWAEDVYRAAWFPSVVATHSLAYWFYLARRLITFLSERDDLKRVETMNDLPFHSIVTTNNALRSLLNRLRRRTSGKSCSKRSARSDTHAAQVGSSLSDFIQALSLVWCWFGYSRRRWNSSFQSVFPSVRRIGMRRKKTICSPGTWISWESQADASDDKIAWESVGDYLYTRKNKKRPVFVD